MAAAAAYAPTAEVTRLTIDSRLEAPVALTLRGGRVLYLDPSSAEVRGEASQSARAITGWSNLLFLGLILTGLYLWFPRRWSGQHLKPILVFNRRARGKARDFNWHHVFGFWASIPLALVVASAVVISFPWAGDLAYRLAGDEPPVRHCPPAGTSPCRSESTKGGQDRLRFRVRWYSIRARTRRFRIQRSVTEAPEAGSACSFASPIRASIGGYRGKRSPASSPWRLSC